MDKRIPDIRHLKYDNKGDSKGATYNFELLEQRKFLILLERESGLKSPGHFHKGATPTTNPQEIIILKGSVKVYCEDLEGNKEEFILKQGEKIEVPAYIFHGYETLENTLYAETRSEIYNPEATDIYSYDEFLKLKK